MYKILFTLFLVPLVASAGLVEKEMTILCGDSSTIITEIKTYNETPIWIAKEASGYTISLWQNKDKKTFTMLKTDPTGKSSCVVSVGSLFSPV